MPAWCGMMHAMLPELIAIAVAGAMGALFRFVVTRQIQLQFGTAFPYGILVVNVVGSLLIGMLAVLLLDRLALGPVWRAALLIGFLGAFTTFSSFSYDTIKLVENGALLAAGFNIILNVVLCLLAAWLGVLIGRTI